MPAEATLAYPDLLDDLAKQIGLDPDALRSQEEISVNGHPLGLALDGPAREGDVLVFAQLGALLETQRECIAITLLEANHQWHGTGGATLALQPDTGAVTLWLRLPIPLLSGELLGEQIRDFAEAAEFWRAQLAEPADPPAPAPSEMLGLGLRA